MSYYNHRWQAHRFLLPITPLITRWRRYYRLASHNHPAALFFHHWHRLGDQWLQDIAQGRHAISPMIGYRRYRLQYFRVEPRWSFIDAIANRIIWFIIKPTTKHIISKHCRHLSGPGTIPMTMQWLQNALTAKPFRYVLRLDIERYYASIHRPTLLKMLFKTFQDPKSHRYFEAIVNPLVDEGTHFTWSDYGIPRQSSLSGFFAALYLTPLDRHFENKTGLFYLRYNDDIIILCQTKRQFQRAKRATQHILASLKLSLSPTKSRMGPIHNGFHFLGIHFKSSLNTHSTPSESTKKTDQPPQLNQPESLLERQEANPSQAVTRIPSGKTHVVATVHPRTCHRAINKCIGLVILEFDSRMLALQREYPHLFAAARAPPPIDHLSPREGYRLLARCYPELMSVIAGDPARRQSYLCRWQAWWQRTGNSLGLGHCDMISHCATLLQRVEPSLTVTAECSSRLRPWDAA